MFKIIKILLLMIWIGDIINFPQLAILDTEIPVNTLAWILIFILILPELEKDQYLTYIQHKED